MIERLRSLHIVCTQIVLDQGDFDSFVFKPTLHHVLEGEPRVNTTVIQTVWKALESVLDVSCLRKETTSELALTTQRNRYRKSLHVS